MRIRLAVAALENSALTSFPKRQILDSSKLEEFKTTISSLMKMEESSPYG